MELVYLWVDSYKNIHKQGFNFSPRFRCEYDDETKELTIDENDDYIENFFGDNINVTAIVGKNGSGKSSVLKFLRLLATSNQNGLIVYYNAKEEKFLYQSKGMEVKTDIKRITFTHENHISFPMFDYSLTYDSLIKGDKWHPLYPDKERNAIFFHLELIQNQRNIIMNYHILKKEKQLDKFKDFFQPKTLLINIDLSSIKPKRELTEDANNKYKKLSNELEKATVNIELINKIREISILLDDEKSYKKSITTEKKFDWDNVQEYSPSLFKLGSYLTFEDDIHNIWSRNFYDSDKDLENIISHNAFNNKKMGIIDKIDELTESVNYTLFSLDINKLNKGDINMIMASFSSHHFKIELIGENEKKLSDLSFGEQQLLFILNQLYALGTQIDIDISDEASEHNQRIYEENQNEEFISEISINHYIVLLDEIDIGFHPDWQKRTIKYIIDFLELIPDKQFHLIFTTHSPFLLSDIPKENIVFLNNELAIKQTFGANIHTLLSNSFFIKDGLMGEFAKGKINEIKRFNEKVIE